MPRGFVRMRRMPGRKPSLVATHSGSMTPVTERPNFMSSSLTVCPPALTQPHSIMASKAPRSTSASTWGFSSARSSGKQATLMALHGVPPMAKISESALQAAMRPKGKGSLTMGARISTDCTRAFP